MGASGVRGSGELKHMWEFREPGGGTRAVGVMGADGGMGAVGVMGAGGGTGAAGSVGTGAEGATLKHMAWVGNNTQSLLM